MVFADIDNRVNMAKIGHARLEYAQESMDRGSFD
jgi:hypothetical protein